MTDIGKVALGLLGDSTSFRASGKDITSKLLSEFLDRGVNVKQFGAVCNANYKNPGNGKWYTDAAFTELASDDTVAIQAAINATPKGFRICLPGSSMISAQISIEKQIEIFGYFGRDKSANLVYGSRIVVSGDITQGSLESAVLINASSVKIRGVALKGQGASFGSVGILCKSSHGSKLEVYVEGFDAGVKMGQGSAHVSLHQSTLTGNNDAVVFGSGNLFDFNFEDVLLDGNVRSGAFLEANTATENITFTRCHMGWPTQYGILQDPTTTTGDGFSGITLIDTPIEQVAIQPMRIINGGNIRVQGGYWTWSAAGSSATEAFYIKNVNIGPIWFSPKLESSYSNPNALYVIQVPGFTNYPIYMDGQLPANFAKAWLNYTAPVPSRYAFYGGLPYMGNLSTSVGATNVTLTDTTKRTLTTSFPVYVQNMMIRFYVRVSATNNLKLQLQYCPAGGVIAGANTVIDGSNNFQTRDILPLTSLAPGEYEYSVFVSIDFHQPVVAYAQTDAANSCRVSCSIIPTP